MSLRRYVIVSKQCSRLWIVARIFLQMQDLKPCSQRRAHIQHRCLVVPVGVTRRRSLPRKAHATGEAASPPRPLSLAAGACVHGHGRIRDSEFPTGTILFGKLQCRKSCHWSDCYYNRGSIKMAFWVRRASAGDAVRDFVACSALPALRTADCMCTGPGFIHSTEGQGGSLNGRFFAVTMIVMTLLSSSKI